MDDDVRIARELTPQVISAMEDIFSKPDVIVKPPAPKGVGRFYIYRIFSAIGETLYIGKGSGNRLSVQKRRFGFDGEIILRFVSEQAAYRAEVRLIKKHNPPLNRNCGGAGGFFGKGKTKEEKLLNRIGTRAFAARILLWCYHHPNDAIHKLVDHTKYDEYRRVAYGNQ